MMRAWKIVMALTAAVSPAAFAVGVDRLGAAGSAAKQIFENAKPDLVDIAATPIPRQADAPPRGRMITKRVTGGLSGRGTVELAHAPLFVVEKSQNQQNILIVYATLTPDCKLGKDSWGNDIGFYWIDNWTGSRASAKFPAGLVESRIRDEISPTRDNETTLHVTMKQLGRVQHDFTEEQMTVRAQTINGACEARAYLKPGGHETRVNWIYADAVPRGFTDAEVRSISIIGHDARDEAKPFERSYPGKPSQDDANGETN